LSFEHQFDGQPYSYKEKYVLTRKPK